MLVLSRKPGETLYLGDSIKVTVLKVKGDRISIGIEAPAECAIRRSEIDPREMTVRPPVEARSGKPVVEFNRV
jgi:carbon storage regulator